MTLGQRLKRYREQRGLKQYQLAKEAKLRPADISELESGKQVNPKWEHIKNLARALKVTPNDLAGKEFSQDPQRTPHSYLVWQPC